MWYYKLELFDIYDSKKITNLEEFLKSCKNLTEITITSYSDLNAVLNSIGFINNLEELNLEISSDDKEMLEDLIMAALNNAYEKAEEMH